MSKNGDRDIKSVRFGYNPNSSSLGVFVSVLIYGTLSLAVVAPLVAMGIRLVKKRNEADRKQ